MGDQTFHYCESLLNWIIKILTSSNNQKVKSEQEKTAHLQKLAISKISIIFVWSLWNLVKMINSRGKEKIRGLFTNSQFLYVCRFFLLRLY